MTSSTVLSVLKNWATQAIQKFFKSDKKPGKTGTNGNISNLNFHVLIQGPSERILDSGKDGVAKTSVPSALPGIQLNIIQIHEDDPDPGDDPNGAGGQINLIDPGDGSSGQIHEDDPDPGDDPNGSGGQIHEDDPDAGDDPNGSSGQIHEDDPDPGDDPNGSGGQVNEGDTGEGSSGQIHEDDPDPGDDPNGSGGNATQPGGIRLAAKLTLPQKMRLQILRT